jgi:hypothetical protein
MSHREIKYVLAACLALAATVAPRPSSWNTLAGATP